MVQINKTNPKNKYSPIFLLNELRELKKQLDREDELNTLLSHFALEPIYFDQISQLVCETIACFILPFMRDYDQAKEEASFFVFDTNFGRFRTETGNYPLIRKANDQVYKIDSLLAWVKYIYKVYVKPKKQTNVQPNN